MSGGEGDDPFFFIETMPGVGDTAELAEREGRHACASRRLRCGDSLSVFDGRGSVGRAVVESVAARGQRVVLRLTERTAAAAPLAVIHLASAVPKGDRQSILLDMATQLGMTDYTPLECARSTMRASAALTIRWQRIVLEACKQSRRAYLPNIHAPADPVAVAAQATARAHDVWVADPDGEPPAATLSGQSLRSMTLLVGPEGGFTEAERSALVGAGARLAALSCGILRVETAAVMLVGCAVAGMAGRSTPVS